MDTGSKTNIILGYFAELPHTLLVLDIWSGDSPQSQALSQEVKSLVPKEKGSMKYSIVRHKNTLGFSLRSSILTLEGKKARSSRWFLISKRERRKSRLLRARERDRGEVEMQAPSELLTERQQKSPSSIFIPRGVKNISDSGERGCRCQGECNCIRGREECVSKTPLLTHSGSLY